MTTSFWKKWPNNKKTDQNCDVLIVGAGYAGLSTAFWLKKLNPNLKIICIDRSAVGSGASGRNAGFLTKGSAAFYHHLYLKWGKESSKKIYNFAVDSIRLAHQHILQNNSEINFEETTSKTLIYSEDFKNQWSVNGFNPEEYDFKWIPSDKLYPPLKFHIWGSYESELEFKINPVLLLHSLKKKLEDAGVEIIEDLSAFKVNQDSVQTELNSIKCGNIVLALNGYFPRFHQAFAGIIKPQRAQMLALELQSYFECPSLHYDPNERIYWRLSEGNKLMIGGKRLLDAQNEACDFDGINPIVQQGLEDYVHKIFGVQFKVVHRWSGIMGFTESELPIIEKASSRENLFLIGGFSGHGMGLGFNSGKELAELVLGIKKQSFFSRFADYKIEV